MLFTIVNVGFLRLGDQDETKCKRENLKRRLWWSMRASQKNFLSDIFRQKNSNLQIIFKCNRKLKSFRFKNIYFRFENTFA